MKKRGAKRSNGTAFLTVLLIALMLSLLISTVYYIKSGNGENDPVSSQNQTVTSLEPSKMATSVESIESIEASSETPSETSSDVSSLTSSAISSATSSENDNVDHEALADLHNTTKGSEEFPYYININRKQNMVIIYAMDDEGYYTVPYKAFVCSCGIPDKDDGIVYTPIGTYETVNKYEWRALNGGVYGQYATRIVRGILFHSVPYYSMDKGDLKYVEYNKLGVAASEGCIRLTVEDAKWIYDNCELGTKVTLYDSDRVEPFEKPTAMKIPEDSENRGWDPTDPDPNNPWNQ